VPANTALRFLVAAREGEIDELEHLAQSTALVTLLARFIHALQRERGLVNLRLADGSGSFDAPWREQVQACLALEGQVRHCLQALDLNPGRVRNGVRLFSRIAQVMHAMDSLPALRARVSASTVSAEDATAALVRLVGGLLSVVFEAADAATDPAVSRALVALFNFMQGKEFAGQERALGARVFTAAHLEDAARARWQTLLDAQSGCLQVFQELGHPPLVRVWQQSAAAEQAAQVMDRLRAAAHQPGAPLLSTGALNLPWYEACTARIDAMKELEDHLCEHLRRLCSQRIEQAREELRDHRAILDALAPLGALPEPALHIGARARDAMQAVPGVVDLNLEPQMEVPVLRVVFDRAALARHGLSIREVFERIAREGRKFGLGLVLSSQRPSELSPTVLAQCNTFLLHRIVNDADQNLVARLVPDNVGGLLRELPSLPSRQAVLLGWAAPIPVLVEVDELPDAQRPQSADPDFWNVWTLAEERGVDWAAVSRAWSGTTPPHEPEEE